MRIIDDEIDDHIDMTWLAFLLAFPAGVVFFIAFGFVLGRLSS